LSERRVQRVSRLWGQHETLHAAFILGPTMRTLPAIATRYKGRVYRSRLEARYASYFDALGWAYEYEPLDLHGYIPDFIIRAPGACGVSEPMVVEVKPFVPPFEDEDVMLVCKRIEDGGWLGDALVVGAQHRCDNQHAQPMMSLLDSAGELRVSPNKHYTASRSCIGRMRDGDGVWHDAFVCKADDGTWQLTHDAEAAWLIDTDFMNVRIAWAEAGNATQWQRPRIHNASDDAGNYVPAAIRGERIAPYEPFDIASLFPTSREGK
jgi:hypothetical protein